MRRTLILTMAVLACAVAVCWASQTALDGAVDRAQALHSQAMLAAGNGDRDRAVALLAQLDQLWQERSGMMEMLASHDALHEVSAAIAEAQICLACRDHDDFLRTMSTVKLGLEHLKEEEALRWGNLY